MREFKTAVDDKQTDPEEEGTEFAVDGVLCTAYRPKDGQLAMLMASTGRHTTSSEQIAGVINFFVNVLDDDSQQYIVGRLLDRTDKFGIDEVQEIMEWLIEEWSARPTKSPSDSRTSRQTGGRKSTGRTPQLTS